MSLFPEGISKGMGGFRGTTPSGNDANVVPATVPVTQEQGELQASATPPFSDILEQQFSESSQSTEQPLSTKENILPVDEKPFSIPIQQEKVTETQPENLSQEKAIEKLSKSQSTLETSPSSVRIAGLTTDDAVATTHTAETSAVIDLVNEVADGDNFSESERAELEEADDSYFQEFPSNKNPAGGISLDELLNLAIDNDASDIHFSAQEKVGLRINGKIHFIENIEPLTHNQAKALVFAMVPNPLHRRRIFENKELDSAYEHKNGVNFRVNIFFKRGRIGGVLRKIASHAMTLDQLGLPAAIRTLLNKKQGLLLVTGPTGSGKSTSMQSMLEYINETRVEHILTIEDPIEYIFQPKKSIFSQREVGRDTYSFENALRASLREDPDVVMIGEMRDAETIQAAMQLSETGHLVISTLHTSSAPQTIARLVSNFPSSEQEQVQSRLADTLIGVLSQRLVSRADREGRVAIFELMIVNSAIRNIVRTGDMTQIHNAMLSGRESGMVQMQDYAAQLEAQGIITEDSYKNFFREE